MYQMPPREFSTFEINIDQFFASNDDIRRFEASLGTILPALEKHLQYANDDWKEFAKVAIKLADLCEKTNIDDTSKPSLLNKLIIGITLKTKWTAAMNRNSKLSQEPYRTFVKYGMEICKLCKDFQEGDFITPSVGSIESTADSTNYDLPDVGEVMQSEDIQTKSDAKTEAKVSVTSGKRQKTKSRLTN